MANTDRDGVVAWLARASEKELTDAIYEAVRTRPRTPDSEDEPGHLVLATASLDRDEGRWELELVARDDPAHYHGGWDSDVPLCQSGQCRNCGNELISWAKHAVCPVCEESVFCT